MTTHPLPAMAREAAESANAARRQIERCGPSFKALGAKLRALAPRFVVTCARGSSDHASAYGKYLIETGLGVPVASIGPSVASLYNAPLQLKDGLFIAVSQSGQSPDLLRLAATAQASGAFVVCFVNDENSPLARQADLFIPLCAGRESSVAATKSYLTSAFAFLQLAAHWRADDGLLAAVERVPDWLDQAARLDWGPALQQLAALPSFYVIGRGLGAGAALEMALKFKETCRLHAEAFSAAEVIHGPLELVRPGFGAIALTQADRTLDSSRDTIHRMVALGATVLSTDPTVPGVVPLPALPDLPPEVAPLAQVQSFYMAVPGLALARGLDPDAPANLKKVTETV
ncbi:glucosamine-fructose-6-phosphate aminotransferase [Aliidongia dinghuensis]|uniref:Glucosamine-fructose-6-phosphate aminotransferase n=1 Tax=Aliidongia dinghuensis TaxID=1867774 RepID=A0A8J2YX01_9PROT|nr:SIS domain-containing protein [Aliidongia dinghuensis]GGF27928.1 glucosamine-fructose-6-phosphate aminotransferase [Aliidongia dinghuensis]